MEQLGRRYRRLWLGMWIKESITNLYEPRKARDRKWLRWRFFSNSGLWDRPAMPYDIYFPQILIIRYVIYRWHNNKENEEAFIYMYINTLYWLEHTTKTWSLWFKQLTVKSIIRILSKRSLQYCTLFNSSSLSHSDYAYPTGNAPFPLLQMSRIMIYEYRKTIFRVTFVWHYCPFPSLLCHIILHSYPFAGQTQMFKTVQNIDGEECTIMWHESGERTTMQDECDPKYCISISASHYSLHSHENGA